MNEIYKRKVIFFSNDCIESFKTTRLNTEFKKLPIQNFYSAIANNSGPIALLYRKFNAKQLKLPENYDKHILFFNCKGDLITTREFDLKERIILFTFTQDEQLLILYATGLYFLVDPATSQIKAGTIFEQNEQKRRCYGAQMIRECIVVLKQKTIGIIHRMGDIWKGYTTMKIHNDYPFFSSSLNQQNELQIIFYSRKNCIELFNLKSWQEHGTNPITIYESPELTKNISNLVSIGKRNQILVLIFTEKAIVVQLNQPGKSQSYQVIKSMTIDLIHYKIQKEDPLTKSETKSKYRNFYKLGWMESTIYFYDRIKLLFFSQSEPVYQLKNLSMTNLLSQDDIGLRLMDQSIFFLRVINNPIYFSLIDQQKISEKILQHKKEDLDIFIHYKQFQQFYDTFMDKKEAVEIKFLQKIKANAEEIWQKLLEIAQIYIDPGEQLRALKFARFLKNYYEINNAEHDVNTLVKQLRVINSLRHQFMNRWLTLSQYRTIKSKDRFLKILLRNNMHFVADMMYEDSRSKNKIFDHWARCKIQAQTQMNALEDIKGKYNQMKRDISNTSVFTDLAKHCLDNKERNLTKLASRLIELETHPGKRCMVVLLIFLSQKDPENIQKLLNFAQESGDSSTIHYTIQSLRRVSQDWLPIKLWQQILPKKPFLENYYIRLLKVNNEIQQLQKYLTTNSLYVSMSYMSLGKQLSMNPNNTLDKVKTIISTNYSKILVSLDENLAKCTQRKGLKILKQLKHKKYPITQQDSKDLQNDRELQMLAELIIKKDQNVPLAIHILSKMKSQKVYDVLIRKGKLKVAIQQAFLRKNKQKLTQLIALAEGQIQQLAKQMLNELQQKR